VPETGLARAWIWGTGRAAGGKRRPRRPLDSKSNRNLTPFLSVPIIQGGRLDADLERARAAHAEGVASYRQKVLVAFREVQDALTATRLLAEQSTAQDRAHSAARRASELARTRFDAGFVSYLDVVDGDRARLTAERAAAQLQGSRFVTAVQLIRALGGGWDAAALPGLGS
jgi:multidrug efflux system outer membrane protein